MKEWLDLGFCVCFVWIYCNVKCLKWNLQILIGIIFNGLCNLCRNMLHSIWAHCKVGVIVRYAPKLNSSHKFWYGLLIWLHQNVFSNVGYWSTFLLYIRILCTEQITHRNPFELLTQYILHIYLEKIIIFDKYCHISSACLLL